MKTINFIPKSIQMFILTIPLMLAPQFILAGVGNPNDDGIKVMTQNLYVGADIFKVLNEGQPIYVNAAEIFADIITTNFAERADVIADQIAIKLPHVIGLQEVSLIRTQCPSDAITGNTTSNAPDVYADYLQILMDALNARGLNYQVVASIQNVDIELPAINTPQILAGCTDAFFDARLTDYDVTLVRADVSATMVLEQGYAANFPVPIPATGGTIVFSRGFTVIDGSYNGIDFRFANTHLEVTGNPYADAFQFAQAYELTETLNVIGSTLGEKITFVVGDFNSDPSQGPLVDCFAPPTFATFVTDGCVTPHFTMLNAGFIDLWSQLPASAGDGDTCCQSDLLDNQNSELSQRIDYVWVKLPTNSPLEITSVDASVLGDNLTTNNLWSSDHAGIAAQVMFGIPVPQMVPTLNLWAILLLVISMLGVMYFQSRKLNQ